MPLLDDSRALAQRLTRQADTGRQLVRHRGVIDAVNADGTVNLKLDGSDYIITSITKLDNVFVVAGDTVEVIVDGTDVIVVGKVSNNDRGLELKGRALVFSYVDDANIDHIWHDDTLNEWHLVSDGAYKSRGGGTLVAGRVKLPGGVGASNLMIDFDYSDYGIWVDDVGSGTAGRIWINAPHDGEIAIGPRSGSAVLNRIRMNGYTLFNYSATINGDLTVGGPIITEGYLGSKPGGVAHTWLPYTNGSNYITSNGAGAMTQLRAYEGTTYYAVANFYRTNIDIWTTLTMNNYGIAKVNHIISNYNGRLFMQDHGNGNVTLRAADGSLYLGYATTIYVYAAPVYDQSTSGGANVNVAGSGLLRRSTSSRRYKDNIRPKDINADALLSIPIVEWQDKNELAQIADADGKNERPNPAYGRWYTGTTAEDVDAAGLKWAVTYDEEGRPDELMYDRLAVALIPVVRDLRDRIVQLERRAA